MAAVSIQVCLQVSHMFMGSTIAGARGYAIRRKSLSGVVILISDESILEMGTHLSMLGLGSS
jgi:hypothetical protein